MYCTGMVYVHAAGDTGNAVQTNLSKMRFHPDFYRANAYQGLIYDPMSMLEFIPNYHNNIIGKYTHRASTSWIRLQCGTQC